MIKRALKEKNVLTTHKSIIHNQKSDKSEQVIKFRSGSIGEKLLKDSDSGSESELFAAINPNDSSNIVVAVIHLSYSLFSVKPLTISIYHSHDFGQTWNKSAFDGTTNQSDIPAGGGDPVLVFDSEGNLHLTYIMVAITDLINSKANEFIYHAVSTDGGKTWTPKEYFKSASFNALDPDLAGIDRFLDKQWMVTDNTESPHHGNVYMGYVDFSLEDNSINMKVDVLGPNDSNFVYNPVTITSDSFYFVQFASVDINNDGDFFISYVGSYDSLHYSIYNSISTDGAKTFSEPRKISNIYYPGFTIYSESSLIEGISERYFPSPYIAIDRSNGNHDGRIYATWTSPGLDTIEITGSDIYLTYSDDKGVNWIDPIIVNNDELNDSDQFYSSLEVNEKGIPILCFYDKRSDPENNFNTDYYISYSLDLDELDFSTQFSLTQKTSDFSSIGNKNNGFGIGEYNKTVSTKSFAIPFWSDGRKNDGDINVYMAIIPLDGKEPNVGFQEISLVSEKIKVKKINPNPNNGEFSLELSLKNSTNISFDLFDINGVNLFNKTINYLNKGNHKIDFLMKNIDIGTYILRIKSKFGVLSRKIIVNKK